MPEWSACTIELRTLDDEPIFVDDDCDVSLEDGSIRITYFDEEGPVVFAGRDDGSGCFELVCRSRPRKGSLRFDKDRARLEGEWGEREQAGRWIILLS